MDSLDDMILLAEVAETGSFTKGGQRLGLPKSTVSQRIARLEARLGLRLLNRSTRQVTLTAAGQVYLDYCRRVRDEARNAAAAMGHLKTQPEGHLRITCPEITASHFMPGFLGGFASAHPGITIDLIATTFGGGRLNAELVLTVLGDGGYRKHMDGLRSRLERARFDIAGRLRRMGIEPWLEPQAGMFLWCRLPGGLDAADVARAALAENIVLAPGNAFSLAQTATDYMRFNVSQSLDERIFEVLQSAMRR